MKLKIRVTFSRRSADSEDSSELLQLTWKVRQTSLGLKYFKALDLAARSNYMYRRDRFYNLPNCYYTEQRIVDRLNQMISLINEYSPGLVPEKAFLGMSQDFMNHLHTYFEKYRGPLLKPHPLYESAPVPVREAFDELNLMIHRYEDAGYSGRDTTNQGGKFYMTFGLSDLIRRYPLGEEDFQHFTFEQDFGTWIVNYCEVGKPLHDVWRDGDLEIGHEAILPLKYYSADSMVVLGHPVTREQSEMKKREFNLWWDQNEARLSALGFKKGNPANSVGHLPVADLDLEQPILAGRSPTEIVKLLSNYQWTSKVECLIDKEVRQP